MLAFIRVTWIWNIGDTATVISSKFKAIRPKTEHFQSIDHFQRGNIYPIRSITPMNLWIANIFSLRDGIYS